MDVGLLIARIVFGLLLAAHGCQKLFGWFGGQGGERDRPLLRERLGFHPARTFVILAGLGECTGGVLLALGLAQPIAAATIVSVMIVAIATVHWGKGLLAPSGIEHPSLYLTAAVMLALTGPGAFALDAALGLHAWWTPQATSLALTAGAGGAVASLAVRRRTSRLAPAHSTS